MSDFFYRFIWDNTQWLYCKLFDRGEFYFDLWSVVHFFSGIILFLIFKKLKVKRPWLYVFSVILIWELFEWFYVVAVLVFFEAETIYDVFNDIILGGLGAYSGYLLLKFPPKKTVLSFQILAVFVISFLWAGYIASSNQCIDFRIFIFGGITGFLMLSFYKSLSQKLEYAALISWGIYLVTLFLFAYLLFHIQRIGGNSAIDLKHFFLSNPKTKFFYISAPLLYIYAGKLSEFFVQK